MDEERWLAGGGAGVETAASVDREEEDESSGSDARSICARSGEDVQRTVSAAGVYLVRKIILRWSHYFLVRGTGCA